MPIRKVFPMMGYLEDNQSPSEHLLPSDVFKNILAFSAFSMFGYDRSNLTNDQCP